MFAFDFISWQDFVDNNGNWLNFLKQFLCFFKIMGKQNILSDCDVVKYDQQQQK